VAGFSWNGWQLSLVYADASDSTTNWFL